MDFARSIAKTKCQEGLPYGTTLDDSGSPYSTSTGYGEWSTFSDFYHNLGNIYLKNCVYSTTSAMELPQSSIKFGDITEILVC